MKLLAHVEACRPDTVFYAGVVGVSGAVFTNPEAPLPQLALAWLVPTLAWIASLYGGDYFDRELDALTKPHRPVPSGRMSAGTAKSMMIAFISAGGLIAVLVNPRTALLAGFATIFGIAYASRLKGRGLWGNTARGLPTALTVLYGSMVVQPWPAWELVPVALMFWVHDSGSNLLGALCDRDGDREGGCLTYPVTHGDEATVRGLVLFYAGWIALGGTWPFLVPIDVPVYFTCLFVSIGLGGVSLLQVARAPRPIPRPVGLRAHEIVVVERIVLGTFLVAASGRPVLALALAVPSMALTVLARRLMRPRYRLT
ncbi:UbiA family prenyltransferase [Lentzea sp. NPDC005914]|uniref:UbiA family prenyltransferase n=1 Tax=Lentzea sp. NPDC005914 TaxID=3154572 RepID=UPI0033D00612